MRRILLSFVASLTGSLFLMTAQPSTAEEAPVYELRIYTTNEGKLDDLLTRFRDHTCRLFEKHGITNIGYWVPVHEEDGASNTLIYVISHKSREAAKASWAGFIADPDWKSAQKASEANGKILVKKPESIFMAATDYSPAIQTGVESPERTFILRTYIAAEGKLPALHARFRDHTVALFSKHGMGHVGYWEPTDSESGAGTKLIYILAVPSEEAGQASFGTFRDDPEWKKVKEVSEADGSLTAPKGVTGVYMKPVDFSPIR